MVVFQPHPEHGVGQQLNHLPPHFQKFFLRHSASVLFCLAAAFALKRAEMQAFGTSKTGMRPRRSPRACCPRPRGGLKRRDHGQAARHRTAQGPHPEGGAAAAFGRRHRSEEHTSELQSLMRISYAVLCLKKKNKYYYTIQLKV